MLIALIAMVALSVLNYTAKALPTGLDTLDLSYTYITQLPACFSQLAELRVLELFKCKQLRVSAAELKALPALRELSIAEIELVCVFGPDGRNQIDTLFV